MKPKPSEQGSILVEMAFALPILALILISIIDLGLIVREYQLVQNAAREGAHFSSLKANQIYFSTDPSGTCAKIKQFVVDYAAQENIAISTSNVTVNQVYNIAPSRGSEITVTYERPILLLGAPFLSAGSLTLTGRSVFFNLYGAGPATLPPGATCP